LFDNRGELSPETRSGERVRIIAGEARGRRLLEPRDSSIRPPLDRIRESVFSMLLGSFEGRTVLDLFAGTGSFGLEAVSRGARSAVFVESSRAGLVLLRKNIESLGFLSRAEVLQGDALRLPDLSSRSPGEIALVFFDPPFKMFRQDQTGERAGQDDRKVLARVAEALSSPALAPDARVVLRIPSSWRGEIAITPKEKRIYGESAVLVYDRAETL
jgi:16S rRNA (guanine(966)-N(2))-methyltransferase RsmD